MKKIITHVMIDEDMLERIEHISDELDLNKSEVIRRTLGYGIGEMELAMRRFLDKSVMQEEKVNG